MYKNALLINLRINNRDKFEHLKTTLLDISNIFDEIHIKIRGLLKSEVIEFVSDKIESNIITYQNHDESDWINTTLEIIENINSSLIFLYNEDHRLVVENKKLNEVLNDFHYYNLDYLTYTFFRASKLNIENILPLQPKQTRNLYFFELNKNQIKILGLISPKYYTVSQASVFSKKYLKYNLKKENKRYKIYNIFFNRLISKLIPLNRRRFYNLINNFIEKFNTTICQYPPSSSFNIEKQWFEVNIQENNWKYGILKTELYANYDDDNGAYGESLIKRGLYPFSKKISQNFTDHQNALSEFKIKLNTNETYNCTYFRRSQRIQNCPMLTISVVSGQVMLNIQEQKITLRTGESIKVFSNLRPFINADEESTINILIFDPEL